MGCFHLQRGDYGLGVTLDVKEFGFNYKCDMLIIFKLMSLALELAIQNF